MRARLTTSVVEAVLERPEPAVDAAAEPARRVAAGTEADKIRRQQQVRRKLTLARRALTAQRSR
ncbi:MAG TPA: hypothetical protein VFP65_20390 [Anaeromyxobacteraceae bacterium]|nr:hypothetical protein [Anaeromyxobacteraceae bacterium]